MNPSPSKSDSELVIAVLNGDRQSFACLVDRYQVALLRVARSQLGRLELAEEAVQDSFVSAYRALRTYDSRYSFRTWLWTILINQCRKQLKRGSRIPKVQNWSDNDQAEIVDQKIESDSSETSPIEAAIENERRVQLEILLRRLPENQATALRLRFFGGLKFQEIADTMNCSLSSSKNRVRVGLEKMSQMLADSAFDLLVGERNESAS